MPAHDAHGLFVICLLLCAAIASVLVARSLRVTPIVGYIAFGALIGPHCLGWVDDGHELRFLGEFGVAFLLFDIGLHFSLKSLWATRNQLFGLGPLQWLLTAVPLGFLLIAYGVGTAGAIFVGGALALSSTAVVLQAFAERGERDTPLGRTVTAVLIFQDLAAVLLLAAIGTVATATASPVAGMAAAVGKIVIAFAAVALLGRAMRPLFGRIVRHEDEATFVATSLLLVLATAGATALIGLSLALGAFLAGMALSESEYCYRVKTEIRPFRGLLLGLFFLTVGMSLDMQSLLTNPGLAIGLLGIIIGVKLASGVVAALVLRQSLGFSTRLGFSLAQGSEFAFVIVALALTGDMLSDSMAAAIVVAVVLSMVATAGLIPLGQRLGRAIEARLRGADGHGPDASSVADPTASRVIINGLDEGGRAVARALNAVDVDYMAVDTDVDRLDRARADGFRAAYGDAWDMGILQTLGLGTAGALVLREVSGRPAVRTIAEIRAAHPRLPILVRALDATTAAAASDAGASVCVVGEADPIELAAETLRQLDVAEDKVERWRAAFLPSEFERADKAHQLPV